MSSGNYYQVLGVTARLGRTIVPDDDRPTAAPVAVISHKYWMSRFGGDPDVVGTACSVNNVPVTIVGVLPPDFSGVEQAVGDAPDVSLPLALEPQFNAGLNAPPARLTQPNFWWLEVMGRLKPGVTAGAGAGQSGGRVSGTRARGLRLVSRVAVAGRTITIVAAGSHRRFPNCWSIPAAAAIYDVDARRTSARSRS